MLTDICFDIQNYIFNMLDLKAQIYFTQTCKEFNKFNITNFWDISYSSIFTEEILKKYPYIIKLNLFDNKKVKNINFLKNVIKLNIGGFCIIEDDGIKDLIHLEELNMSCNHKITNLDNKHKIKVLDISGISNISKSHIKHLNLTSINTYINPHFS
jgi:hypothetical protein